MLARHGLTGGRTAHRPLATQHKAAGLAADEGRLAENVLAELQRESGRECAADRGPEADALSRAEVHAASQFYR